MDQPKIERVLRLIQMMSGNKNYTIDQLADMLGTSYRSIYRYIDTFKECGFAVLKVRSNVYKLGKMPKAHTDLQNLISSINFLKQLLEMAKELLEEEKMIEQPQDKRAQAKAALTELFQSIKTDETPIIVEQVVNDIDNEVVNIIRQFNDAFQSVTARREIKKKLRSILWLKYQIKDNDVFERAYQYIEQYY